MKTFFGLSILCLLTLTTAQSRGLRKYSPLGTRSFDRTVPMTRHRKQTVEGPKNNVEEDQPLTEEEQRQKQEDAIIARVGSFAFMKIGNSLVYNRGIIPKSLIEGVPSKVFLLIFKGELRVAIFVCFDLLRFQYA